MSRAAIFKDKTAITEKIREAARSVFPIVLIVVLLCFCVLPVGTDIMLSFLIGTVFVILGIGLFSLGADISMVPIGTKVGTALTKTRRLGLILPVAFILGFAVTVAEPDLQVLRRHGAAYKQRRAAYNRRCGRGLFSYRVYAAHYNGHKPVPLAYSILCGGVCACRLYRR